MRPVSTALLASLSVTASCVVSVGCSDDTVAATLIVATGAGTTVTVTEEKAAPLVAVMVVLPTPVPVTLNRTRSIVLSLKNVIVSSLKLSPIRW